MNRCDAETLLKFLGIQQYYIPFDLKIRLVIHCKIWDQDQGNYNRNMDDSSMAQSVEDPIKNSTLTHLNLKEI